VLFYAFCLTRCDFKAQKAYNRSYPICDLGGDDMLKKKWKKRLLWVGSSLVVLLAIGYFGMNIAMSYVLQSMIPQVPIEISGQALESDSLTGSIGISEEAESGVVPTDKAAESSVTNVKQGEANSQGSQSQSTTAPIGTSKSSEAVVSGSSAVSEPSVTIRDGHTAPPTPQATKDSLGYQAQVSTEKAKAVQDAITLKEKAVVTSVLLKKLSASDLQLFAKMAGNGLSMEEKKNAKEIILQKLSENEYNQLIGIAAKYGLSQGKSYKDTQK
jgi:hypothetical protein